MRVSRALPLSLLLLGCLGGAASGQPRGAGEKAERPAPWAQAGQFSTREQHVCSWQLVRGEEATELQLSCQAPGEGGSEGLRCAYRGQPERCAAYSAKSRQYWKQILGKLRRKRRPCQDSSPLKARLCSNKNGPPEAQLRLAPASPSPAAPGAAGDPARGNAKGRGSVQEAPTLQQPGAPGAKAMSSGAHAGAPEKRGKAGKRKGGAGFPVPPERRPPTAGGNPEPPTELSEDLAETYCAEQWHSLCSFFVNFWNG
ncbi:fibroblast growth factor-binding protein 3 [Mauremys reevesii]|uniref:fibroblast growth factor-binding protein 3 n=1 Tax=Mauremys reevesii TaxID=260615 RepID=UPI00193F0E25|nr:fibroblast growth factor-binding protein 3 [Mauremys reevesii]